MNTFVGFYNNFRNESATAEDFICEARDAKTKQFISRGDLFKNLIKESSKRKILFVCTENTCRSQMAAAIAQNQLDAKYKGKFFCNSAGAAVKSYYPKVAEFAANAIKEIGCGVLPSDTKTTSIDDIDVSEYDMVFALSDSCLRTLKQENPNMAKRIVLYDEKPIPDPFDLEHFPEDWPTPTQEYGNRNQDEKNRDYEYVAKQMIDKYTPQIMKTIKSKLLSFSTGMCGLMGR